MSCKNCGGEGFVTAQVKCPDPDNCIDGGPLSGFHDIDIECPCCVPFEDDDDDEDEEEEGDEEE